MSTLIEIIEKLQAEEFSPTIKDARANVKCSMRMLRWCWSYLKEHNYLSRQPIRDEETGRCIGSQLTFTSFPKDAPNLYQQQSNRQTFEIPAYRKKRGYKDKPICSEWVEIEKPKKSYPQEPRGIKLDPSLIPERYPLITPYKEISNKYSSKPHLKPIVRTVGWEPLHKPEKTKPIGLMNFLDKATETLSSVEIEAKQEVFDPVIQSLYNLGLRGAKIKQLIERYDRGMLKRYVEIFTGMKIFETINNKGGYFLTMIFNGSFKRWSDKKWNGDESGTANKGVNPQPWGSVAVGIKDKDDYEKDYYSETHYVDKSGQLTIRPEYSKLRAPDYEEQADLRKNRETEQEAKRARTHLNNDLIMKFQEEYSDIFDEVVSYTCKGNHFARNSYKKHGPLGGMVRSALLEKMKSMNIYPTLKYDA